MVSTDTQITQLLILWKNYPNKIDEIKADAKWKEIEHTLDLDHCEPAVWAIGFFSFYKRNILLAS